MRTDLAELAGWARARLPQLIDHAYEAILGKVSLYGEGRLVPLDDLRRSVEHNLKSIITSIGDPDAPLD